MGNVSPTPTPSVVPLCAAAGRATSIVNPAAASTAKPIRFMYRLLGEKCCLRRRKLEKCQKRGELAGSTVGKSVAEVNSPLYLRSGQRHGPRRRTPVKTHRRLAIWSLPPTG